MVRKYLMGIAFALVGNAFAADPRDVISRDFYSAATSAHLNLEQFFPKDSLFFVGDSLIQNLPVGEISKNSVNLGIPGDTSSGVLNRMRQYKSLDKARVVVLESGVNDLGFGRYFDGQILANFEQMLGLVPAKVKIVVLGIFPVDERVDSQFKGYNERIGKVNARLASVCAKSNGCIFVDLGKALSDGSGNLLAAFHSSKDAVHYNEAGRKLIIEAIKRVVLPSAEKP